MNIGDKVRFRSGVRHREMLGPIADEVGKVVDAAMVDGVETVSVIFGDNGTLEAAVPAFELEIVALDDTATH